MTQYYEKTLAIVQKFEFRMNDIINNLYHEIDAHDSICEFVESIVFKLNNDIFFKDYHFSKDDHDNIICEKIKDEKDCFFISSIMFNFSIDNSSYEKVFQCVFDCFEFKKKIGNFDITYVFSDEQNEMHINSELHDFDSMLLFKNNSITYFKAQNYDGFYLLNNDITGEMPESKEVKEIISFLCNIYSISIKKLIIIEKFLFEKLYLTEEEKDSFYLINDISFFEDKWNDYTMNINAITFKLN